MLMAYIHSFEVGFEKVAFAEGSLKIVDVCLAPDRCPIKSYQVLLLRVENAEPETCKRQGVQSVEMSGVRKSPSF